MQKFGRCELCGRAGLVADYGPKSEDICVDCANSPELREHVDREMIKRHGKELVDQWYSQAYTGITKH